MAAFNNSSIEDISFVDSQDISAEDAELANEEKGLGDRIIAGLSLVVFTVLAICNPILVRVAHKEAEAHGHTFVGSTTVFAVEFFKIIICCIASPITNKSLKKFLVMLYQSFTVNKVETMKICLPALMFVVQNNLYFFALQHIDAALFSVTFQLRILTTVLLMMIVLNRRFTMIQWVALFLSLVGVVIVQLGGHSGGTHSTNPEHHGVNPDILDKFLGLGAVLIMCMTTAFGSVYMEAVMKKSEADVFLQNIRLSLISLPLSIVAMFFDSGKITNCGFFYGWNYYVWLVIAVRAFGGIMVSVVIKRTDNVKKGFCQALALGGTAAVAISLGDSKFSYYLLAGILIVVSSVILYALATRRQREEAELRAFEQALLSDDKKAFVQEVSVQEEEPVILTKH
ncbi:Nucleotide Sugar TransPorter family [Aphelenchoides bicaudatus]|nr:Nucleotide Sugar TransPorter family [Aphelenchoides bicaudatus]